MSVRRTSGAITLADFPQKVIATVGVLSIRKSRISSSG
jgi:hypothetical protein